jgi:beta-N-acetylhexosaminidase
MERLSSLQKIGQRFAAGFPSYDISDDFVRLVKEYKIGNVILFKENIKSKEQLFALCGELQTLIQRETGYPAFIAIDQEGGVVSRLGSDAAVIPSAMAIAATGNVQNAYEAGLITGRELKAMGVNMNLAPDMDVNSNPRNPVIGVRSYGDTAETVSSFGVQMIRGLQDAGVLCTAKHFPGHGDTAVDSHLGLPCVNKTLEELMALELKPFKAAIQAGVSAVMTSHILFPKLEPDGLPATMSRRIITDLLKKKLGFSGLVLSDCMMMNAIQGHFGTVNGCLMAAKAGVDLIFISHSRELAGEAAHALLEAYENGGLDRDEMDASVQKILRFKQDMIKIPAPDIQVVGCSAHREAVACMMAEAVTEVNVPASGRPKLGSSPLFLGCHPFRPTIASNPEDQGISFPRFMAERLGGDYLMTSIDPGEAEINAAIKASSGHSCLVVGTYNGHLKLGQIALVKALCFSSIPIVCVALRNPYDLAGLPPEVYTLAAYAYDDLSLNAVANVLTWKANAPGKLPVAL